MAQCHDEFVVQSPSTFYKPLLNDEIRLLRMDRNNDPIIISQLVHIPFSADPAFWALSYTWGSKKNMEKILVNGSAFHVTINLYDALFQIRKMLPQSNITVQYIWVDAICLNQDDEREKSIEVPRMHLIYGRSKRVLAWLGLVIWEQEKSVKQLVTKINGFNALAERSKMPLSRVIHAYSNSKSSLLSIEHRRLLDTLRDIGERAWFKRLWVVQETAMAIEDPVMLLGPHSFSFESYFSLRKALDAQYPQHQSIPYHHRVPCHDLVRKNHRQFSTISRFISLGQTRKECAFEVLELLYHTSSLEASVPHDYVYGLLGLLQQPRLPFELIPRYSDSFEEVYHECVRYILKETKNIGLLSLGRLGNLSDVPSWVPDFRHRNPQVKDYREQQTNFLITENSILSIRMAILGKCVSISSFYTFEEFSATHWHNIIVDWHQTVFTASARIKNISADRVAEDWFQMRFRYMDSGFWSHDSMAHQLQHFMRIYHDAIHGDQSYPQLANSSANSIIGQTGYLAGLFCSQIFTLTDGTLGYLESSSNQMKCGDLLCILPTIDQPMVVRFVGGDQHINTPSLFHDMIRIPDGPARGHRINRSSSSPYDISPDTRSRFNTSRSVYDHQHRIVTQAVLDGHDNYDEYHDSIANISRRRHDVAIFHIV